MVEQDTVRLLRECDAGIKMGVSSIEDVVDRVKDANFRRSLVACKEGHTRLQEEVHSLLEKYRDGGKDPNPLAKSMSHVKISMRLVIRTTDSIIADLMTDGCNMGVKSLHRYLNQYKAADAQSRDITRRLASLEERLAEDIRPYL